MHCCSPLREFSPRKRPTLNVSCLTKRVPFDEQDCLSREQFSRSNGVLCLGRSLRAAQTRTNCVRLQFPPASSPSRTPRRCRFRNFVRLPTADATCHPRMLDVHFAPLPDRRSSLARGPRVGTNSTPSADDRAHMARRVSRRGSSQRTNRAHPCSSWIFFVMGRNGCGEVAPRNLQFYLARLRSPGSRGLPRLQAEPLPVLHNSFRVQPELHS